MTHRHPLPAAIFHVAIVLSAVAGCSDEEVQGADQAGTTTASSAGGVTTGGGASGGAGGAGGATGATSTGAGGIPLPTEIAACQGHIYACGDLVDNDMDGVLDAQDPDCLGPCDNTEDGLYGGIPGQSGPACLVDCYFDQDSGAGNDDCHWNHACDPFEAAPDYFPEPWNGAQCAYDPAVNTPGTPATCAELDAVQSAQCHEVCGPLTPNGCDCFGCCELPAGGGKYVWLGSEDENGNGTCTLDAVADPERCAPCTPVAACLNDCGACELCLGKTTLPPWCYPGGSSSSSGGGSGAGGGPPQQCDDAHQPCGLPGQELCPSDHYCITGCCFKVPS